MAVAITYDNGSLTRAVDQNTALVYWYGTMEDDGSWVPKNPVPLKVYVGPKTEFHKGEQFIDQMIACVERHFGMTPQINRKSTHLLQCQMLLEFLREHGNIRELVFADSTDELPPIDWTKLPKL